MPPADRLAEQWSRHRRYEQRLQPDDQGGGPGLHALVDGGEDPAQIDAVQQEAGDQLVQHQCGPRPAQPQPEDDAEEAQGDHGEADGEEGHRLDMRQAELGADEARAPEEDEEGGRAEGDDGAPVHPVRPATRTSTSGRVAMAAIVCSATALAMKVAWPPIARVWT